MRNFRLCVFHRIFNNFSHTVVEIIEKKGKNKSSALLTTTKSEYLLHVHDGRQPHAKAHCRPSFSLFVDFLLYGEQNSFNRRVSLSFPALFSPLNGNNISLNGQFEGLITWNVIPSDFYLS